jgi:hypothetical protein
MPVWRPQHVPVAMNTVAKRRYWWCVVLLVLALVGGIGVFVLTAGRGKVQLSQIKAEDIASGRLLLVNVFGPDNLITDPLQPSVVADILDALEPSHVDPHPLKWAVLGVLDVELKNGKSLEIALYYTGLDEGAFDIDRIYYRGGSDSKLLAALHRANPSWKSFLEQGQGSSGAVTP